MQYFPDEYNGYLFAFDVPAGYEDKANEWYFEYIKLHQYILINKYGLDTFNKMVEEHAYQQEKKAYYFHDSSAYMRNDNEREDGLGCTGDHCIAECKFYQSSKFPELLPLLDECKHNAQLLNSSDKKHQYNKREKL